MTLVGDVARWSSRTHRLDLDASPVGLVVRTDELAPPQLSEDRVIEAQEVAHTQRGEVERGGGECMARWPTIRARSASRLERNRPREGFTRYSLSMTKKIAVSLPDEQVDSIRRAVDQGRAASVSGFISAAVARAEREDSLARLLDDLDRELGSVDQDDLVWADEALGL